MSQVKFCSSRFLTLAVFVFDQAQWLIWTNSSQYKYSGPRCSFAQPLLNLCRWEAASEDQECMGELIQMLDDCDSWAMYGSRMCDLHGKPALPLDVYRFHGCFREAFYCMRVCCKPRYSCFSPLIHVHVCWMFVSVRRPLLGRRPRALTKHLLFNPYRSTRASVYVRACYHVLVSMAACLAN